MIKSIQEMIAIKKRVIIGISVVLVLCVALSIFTERTYTKTEYGLFDTVCTITTTSGIDHTNKYMSLLRDIHSELDVFDENSNISRLNSGEKVSFSEGVHNHIERAFDLSNDLDEYFSILLAPVYNIWNDAIEKKEVPSYDELDSLKHKDFAIIYNDGVPFLFVDRTIMLNGGVQISLGATAKGYATKVLLDKMLDDNVKSALINLGGNIYAHGRKPDGTNWTVGIADPENPAKSAVTLVAEDIAVITSGDYERYFEKDGKRYHHIIDPETLMPAESGIHSATAIGKDAELCDIMSTTLFVAGPEKAKELCNKYEIDTIMISDDTIYYTEGAFSLIKEYDTKYELLKL